MKPAGGSSTLFELLRSCGNSLQRVRWNGVREPERSVHHHVSTGRGKARFRGPPQESLRVVSGGKQPLDLIDQVLEMERLAEHRSVLGGVAIGVQRHGGKA